MAKKAGYPQNFFIGGYDLSGDVGVMDRVAGPRTTLAANGLNSSAMERLIALSSGEMSFRTYFNDAANQQHVALKGLGTTDKVAMWFTGTTLDDVCAMLNGKQINYDPTRGADGSLLFLTQVLGNADPIEWGNTVTAGKITHSSAGSSTGSIGTQTTNGAVGYINIFSVGSGTPTFILQDSQDTSNGIDGTWATLITFATQAQGAERKEVSGTIDKGLRMTTTGSFANAVFAVGLRRGESVDDVAYA